MSEIEQLEHMAQLLSDEQYIVIREWEHLDHCRYIKVLVVRFSIDVALASEDGRFWRMNIHNDDTMYYYGDRFWDCGEIRLATADVLKVLDALSDEPIWDRNRES